MGLIYGCVVARGAPKFFHLFFTDDSVLFFQANEAESLVIKEVLRVHEMASGQVVNL